MSLYGASQSNYLAARGVRWDVDAIAALLLNPGYTPRAADAVIFDVAQHEMSGVGYERRILQGNKAIADAGDVWYRAKDFWYHSLETGPVGWLIFAKWTRDDTSSPLLCRFPLTLTPDGSDYLVELGEGLLKSSADLEQWETLPPTVARQDVVSLLPPSVADLRFDSMERVMGLARGIYYEQILRFYDIKNAPPSALPLLAEQFDVLGYKGWLLAEADDEKRDLLRNAFELHSTRGTPYSIKRALEILNFTDLELIENPPLIADGSALADGQEDWVGFRYGAFTVSVTAPRPLSEYQIDLVRQLVLTWKNFRSELLDIKVNGLGPGLLLWDGTAIADGTELADGVLGN